LRPVDWTMSSTLGRWGPFVQNRSMALSRASSGSLAIRPPDPAGVWRLIQQWDIEAVLGNHDDDVLRKWKPARKWKPRKRKLPRDTYRWLRRRPLMMYGPRWVTVHAGIHPRKGPGSTKRRHALHMKRWKTAKGKKRYWWQLYEGADLVIHGHDAANGLIDRRPYTLGLDTACVKGGHLTGYLLEQDRLVHVAALYNAHLAAIARREGHLFCDAAAAVPPSQCMTSAPTTAPCGPNRTGRTRR